MRALRFPPRRCGFCPSFNRCPWAGSSTASPSPAWSCSAKASRVLAGLTQCSAFLPEQLQSRGGVWGWDMGWGCGGVKVPPRAQTRSAVLHPRVRHPPPPPLKALGKLGMENRCAKAKVLRSETKAHCAAARPEGNKAQRSIK